MGIYFLAGEESKEAKLCPLDRCQPLPIEAVCLFHKGLYGKE